MKYVAPDCTFFAVSSNDVITASELSGKITNYNSNDEDTLNWALQFNE